MSKKFSSGTKNSKQTKHTDDLTLAVEIIQSIEETIVNIPKICDHAGSKMNMTNIQCALLGNLKDRYKEISSIKTTNDAVCYLRLYVGHKK